MNDNEHQIATSVLVIGTGGAGLRAAIELAERSVDVLAVGKRPKSDAPMGTRASRLLVNGFRSPAPTDQVTVPAQDRPGVTINRNRLWPDRGITDSSAANSARSAQDGRRLTAEVSGAAGRRVDAEGAESQPLSMSQSAGTIATTPEAGQRVGTRTLSAQAAIIHRHDREPQGHRPTPP
jgi:glycine/D-amino acid oxidase-like deaminating enzyme